MVKRMIIANHNSKVNLSDIFICDPDFSHRV